MTTATMMTRDTEMNKEKKRPIVVVLTGPTAVGKSAVAAQICADNNGIIVSADSVQAYRGVQIGANKPTKEELDETPHLLVDVADHTENYNAAEWRRDALAAIHCLVNGSNHTYHDGVNIGEVGAGEKRSIPLSVEMAKQSKNFSSKQSVLPVVTGGTMMYLQWLVQGSPDAEKPSSTAVEKAARQIAQFQDQLEDMNGNINEDKKWEAATQYVASLGEIFAERITKLAGKDWYRLQRMLEVAYTVEEKSDDAKFDEKNGNRSLESLYSGQREGSLESLGYDVRCFFLCPDDRMRHTKTMDLRCEDMICRGLIKETADLILAEQFPDMAAKAIGYRQTLEYLGRDNATDDDYPAFQEYLERFTAATRRYARKQMQWFRKEKDFVFVPVSLSAGKLERVEMATKEIKRMIELPRKEYDDEISPCNDTSISEQTRKKNEEQGKKMKTYHFEPQLLKPGTSPKFESALREADKCTKQFTANQNQQEKYSTS